MPNNIAIKDPNTGELVEFPATPSLGVLDARYVETDELAYVSPVKFDAVGDGSSDDSGAFATMLSAVPAGAVVDLMGKTFRLNTTWTVSKRITLRNGHLTSATDRVVIVTAGDTRFENVKVTRTGGTTNSGALVWNATNGRIIDCTATSTLGEGLRLGGNNACAGTKVVRGYYESSDQGDSYGVQLVTGGHNYDVSIENATVRNTGYGTGIGFYNCSRSSVRHCDVRSIRRSPIFTVTGWTLVSGTVYRALDRTDTESNAVYVNGTEYTKNSPSDSTSPASGRYTVVGGYLYINTGVNPGTQTVTTTRTNGYGILFYASSSESVGMSDNLMAHNYVEDTDGFGLYYQTLQNVPKNNRTLKNTLRNTCLQGVTVADLPFAAIGVFGGIDVQLDGDYISGVGASGKTAPGIEFKASTGTPSMTATLSNVTVKGATSKGIVVSPGTYSLNACSVSGSGTQGVMHGTVAASDVFDISLNDCEIVSNGSAGLEVTQSVGAEIRVSVMGGKFFSNGLRAMRFNGARDVRIIGSIFNNNTSYAVNVTNTCLRVLIDDIQLRAGQGLDIASGIADLTIGKVVHDGSSGTKFNVLSPYKTSGVSGGAYRSEWVGAGSPEAVVTAGIGSTYRNVTTGGIWTKSTGTGNTGWVSGDLITSPDGTKYSVTVANGGALTTTVVA